MAVVREDGGAATAATAPADVIGGAPVTVEGDLVASVPSSDATPIPQEIPQEWQPPHQPPPTSADGSPEAKPKAAKIASQDDAATAAHGATAATEATVIPTGDSATAGSAQTTPVFTATSTALPPDWPKPYYLEAGLRRVEPYYFTYKTWVKERWRGRTLIEVFESEFRDRPLAYYRAAMESGTVAVGERTVGPDHVLRNGERISHTTHRHEPPVTADPVGIIHEDADMLVINKPAGVPVHPAGRYMYNSVVEILKHERGPEFVPYPCNRLDRLTSGVMFFGKSPTAAKRLSLQIQARAVRKEYLARVVGKFPDGEVLCDQPILQISPQLGLNRVRANGRSARTVFKRLAYYGPEEEEGEEGGDGRSPDEAAAKNENLGDGRPPSNGAYANPPKDKRGYSIVRCLPVTGRTHQIRVHLQYLGHPIENDPIYANQKVWGFDLGQGDADATRNTDEDIISRLKRMGKEDVAEAVAYYDEMVDEYHKRKAEKMSGALCPQCDTPLYTDPGAHELSLWLHSLRYEAADGSWSYVSPLPAWALPPAGAAGPTEVGGLQDLVGATAGLPDVEPEADRKEGKADEAGAAEAKAEGKAAAVETPKAAPETARSPDTETVPETTEALIVEAASAP